MKTNRIIFCIFLLSHVTGGLCESSCNRKGEEGLIRKENGGKVTLQVKTTEEIQEVHWIRQQTHNVFFRMAYCCTFKSVCCRAATPEGCCRVENETYEAKLCSCNVSSLSASITMCNVTGEDEGVFQADIQHENDGSTCTFYLSIDGKDDGDVKPETNIMNAESIAALVIAICVVISLIGAVIYDCKTGWRISNRITDLCSRGRTSGLESSAATSVLFTSDRSPDPRRPDPEPVPEREPLSSGLELQPMAPSTSDRSLASCSPDPEPDPEREPLSSGLEFRPMAPSTSDRSLALCRADPEHGAGFECSSL